MSLQSAGRAQLAKMRRLARYGVKEATFRLFDDITYDPETGTATEPVSEITITVFAAKGTSHETKAGPIVVTEYQLVFEHGLLPRVPMTQDEVLIDGILYKVSAVGSDPIGVQLNIGVCRA